MTSQDYVIILLPIWFCHKGYYFCWYMTPLKEKYVVVTMNFNKSIKSSTVRRVLV